MTTIVQVMLVSFFDLFVYSAQEAKWCCTKCGRREKAERQGVEVKTQEVQPVESLLKMNIGFFSRMKSVWCTLDKDHMNVYDKKKVQKKIYFY